MFSKRTLSKVMTVALLLGATAFVFAQSGGASAIGSATQKIKSYWNETKLLIQAVGGVVGLVGGLRIYNKWINGDQDINKELVGWGGACLFLIIVPEFVTAFFG